MVALVAPHVRTVKTSSGATAVQIVHSNRRGSRDIEHIGSAHTPADVEVLKAVARERLAAGQGVLDLQVAVPGEPGSEVMALPAGALPIRSSRMAHLADALGSVFERLGFTEATGRDAVFAALVLARIIEPSSKLDSIRVLHEAGLPAPSYRTIKRRLPGYAKDEFQQRISAACAAHAGLGPASQPPRTTAPSKGNNGPTKGSNHPLTGVAGAPSIHPHTALPRLHPKSGQVEPDLGHLGASGRRASR